MRRELLFLLIVAVGSLLSSQQPFSRAITYEEGTSLKGGQTDWCAYPSIVIERVQLGREPHGRRLEPAGWGQGSERRRALRARRQ
jgi:hypothetical protein